jgi:adenylylsulfate kinase
MKKRSDRASAITAQHRAYTSGHYGAVIWLTGLPSSGKSTLASAIEKELFWDRISAYMLDGDEIRQGLCKDLGFSEEDRMENVRRAAESASMMADAGLIVLASFISPLRKMRSLAREIVGQRRFIEIHVSCPLETCIQRDVKGLYKKAIAGEIKGFTGISGEYESPLSPEIKLDTGAADIVECTKAVCDYIRRRFVVVPGHFLGLPGDAPKVNA